MSLGEGSAIKGFDFIKYDICQVCMASVAFDAIYVSYIYRVYLIPLIISASNKSLSQKNSVNFASYVGP